MTSNAAPSLKPLSLAQRPLQLRSTSSPGSTTPISPVSTPVTPSGSKDLPSARHQKRFSTLSYSSSSIIQAVEALESPLPGSPVVPSRKSSHRGSVDASLLAKKDLNALKAVNSNDLVQTSPEGTTAQEPVPVLTLAERHADLLQFIAQKEAKCLELRSQLAQHEADLQQLKAKWTSILNKANPSFATSPGGNSNTSTFVFREGMGRLFGGVTAPLVSALEALEDPLQLNARNIASTSEKEETSSSLPPALSNNFSDPRVRAQKTHGRNTLSSSSLSSSSSLATSRYSVSAASVTSDEADMHSSSLSDGKHSLMDSDHTTTSTTRTSAARRTSLLVNSPLSRNLDSNQTSPESEGTFPLTPLSWTAGLPGLDMKSFNKKWEEIQKGETFVKGSKRASTLLSDVSTSFINTFAPPINEPLHPHKPRLSSHPPSALQSSQVGSPLSRTLSQQTCKKHDTTSYPDMPSTPSSGSLLDEANEDNTLLGFTVETASAAVLVPIKPKSIPSKDTVKTSNSEGGNGDDDEWNW